MRRSVLELRLRLKKGFNGEQSPILKFNNHRYEEDSGPFRAHNSINNKSAKPSDAKHPRPRIVGGFASEIFTIAAIAATLPGSPPSHFKSRVGVYDYAKYPSLIDMLAYFFSGYRDHNTYQNSRTLLSSEGRAKF